ncbi:hypothetical protein CEXT_156751 [Caerostris extrusa]|uniref:Uncharacterized protein n=1 Tax=Caerostris extrusa TaxID=172846 RepID=A0AAV4NBE0_CAEEX|nr:hypothetical protein CEXT_156751 [Caerostris extrusa]
MHCQIHFHSNRLEEEFITLRKLRNITGKPPPQTSFCNSTYNGGHKEFGKLILLFPTLRSMQKKRNRDEILSDGEKKEGKIINKKQKKGEKIKIKTLRPYPNKTCYDASLRTHIC